MFSLILRNAGFRRTLQPIILQTKEIKREVIAADLDHKHPNNPFNNDIHKLWVVDAKKDTNFHLNIPKGTYIH